MGSFRGCTNCLLVLKAPVLQEGSVWGQEGEWVEDRPSGNPASVFLGRRPRGGTPPPTPISPLPSGPGSTSLGGWFLLLEGAAGPPPRQPSAGRPAPRTAHAPPLPRSSGGLASLGSPAPGACKAHTGRTPGFPSWVSPAPAGDHRILDSLVPA